MASVEVEITGLTDEAEGHVIGNELIAAIRRRFPVADGHCKVSWRVVCDGMEHSGPAGEERDGKTKRVYGRRFTARVRGIDHDDLVSKARTEALEFFGLDVDFDLGTSDYAVSRSVTNPSVFLAHIVAREVLELGVAP